MTLLNVPIDRLGYKITVRNMKPRAIALAVALGLSAVTLLGGWYAERMSIPDRASSNGFEFMPGVNIPDDMEWNRENWYINLNNWVRQGLGPSIPFNQVDDEHTNPNRIKVLAIGDSFAWGTGVTNLNERWQNKLQHELDTRAGYGVFEVKVLGRMGLSTMEEAEVLEDNIDRIKPDLIVIGLVTNDIFPSGREKRICGDAVGEGCSQDTPEMLPAYRDCLNGEDDMTSRLLGKGLGKLFPNLAGRLLDRYCDLDRFAAKHQTLTQDAILQDLKKSPYREVFLRSIDDLKRTAGSTPIYVYPFVQSQRDAEVVPQYLTSFEAGGISSLPMGEGALHLGKGGVQNLGPDAITNPVDFHPGPMVTTIYASDIAEALLERVDKAQLEDARASAQQPRHKLISNFLPLALQISEEVPGRASVTIPANAVFDRELPGFTQGIEHPTQDAPCALLGKPYGVIGLNPALTDTGTLVIESIQGQDLELYVGGYTPQGTRTKKLLGKLSTGKKYTLRLEGNGNEVLYIADPSRSCSVTDHLTLPEVSFRITRTS